MKKLLVLLLLVLIFGLFLPQTAGACPKPPLVEAIYPGDLPIRVYLPVVPPPPPEALRIGRVPGYPED